MLVALMLAVCGPSEADTMDNVTAVSEKVDAFYCTTSAGKPRTIILAPVKGGKEGELFMFPEGYPTRKIGQIFATDLPNGTLSIDEGSLVALTDDGIETGTCNSFNSEMLAFMFALGAADPEMLAGAAGAAALGELRFQNAGLKQQVKDLNISLAAQREAQELAVRGGTADARQRLEDGAEAYRTALDKLSANNPMQPTVDRLKRENDKLKQRICAMDPKATFTVCQP